MICTLVLILNLIMSKAATHSASVNTVGVRTETLKSTAKTLDISGFWEGTITRDEGYGRRVNFDIEIIFTQKGNDITGISIVRAKADNKTYSAKMELGGKLKGTYLKYVESKILMADVIPDADWCIKKVELIYKTKDNVPSLEGIWEGVTGSNKNCIPGRLTLKRKPPRV